MKHIFLFAASMLLRVTTSSQVFEWGIQSGGSGLDVVSDKNGNVYSVGEFVGSTAFDLEDMSDSLTSKGGYDYYILKEDKNGDVLWARSVGSSDFEWANALSLDDSANIYITGRFSGTADFDPGPDTFYMSNNGPVRVMFIQKLDRDGNFIWAKKLNNGSTSEGADMEIKGDAMYITGIFNGSVDFDPGPDTSFLYASSSNGFAARYDTSGNLIWVKQLGVFHGDALDLTLPSGIVIGGNAGDSVMICKYDALGNQIWKNVLDGGINLENVCSDLAGNVYGTGSFGGTATFDPDINGTNLNSQGDHDIFVFQWSASGNHIWSKSIGSPGIEYAHEIAADGLGHLYIGGHFNSKLDFDPSYNDDIHVASGQTIFLLKLRVNGDHLWAGTMGGDLQFLNGMHISPENHIFLTGNNYENFDCDPTGGTHLLQGGSYVVKLDGNAVATGADEYTISPVRIFPNPCLDHITIESDSPCGLLLIYDLNGRVVGSEKLGAGIQRVAIHLAKGVYLAEIHGSAAIHHARLVVR